jgi:hypothetical protein
MPKPTFKMIDDPSPDLDHIRGKAEEYLAKSPASRMKMLEKEPRQIRDLLWRIYDYEQWEFAKGFETLGLRLVTFDDFTEIPGTLGMITNG